MVIEAGNWELVISKGFGADAAADGGRGVARRRIRPFRFGISSARRQEYFEPGRTSGNFLTRILRTPTFGEAYSNGIRIYGTCDGGRGGRPIRGRRRRS